MLKNKGCQDRFLWDAVLEACQPAPLAVSGGKGEALIVIQLHDHADHVSMSSNRSSLQVRPRYRYHTVL